MPQVLPEELEEGKGDLAENIRFFDQDVDGWILIWFKNN